MHYANGKEAKVGDEVVAKDARGDFVAGTVVKTFPDAETCDLVIVPSCVPTSIASAGDCLLAEDADLVAKEG
jgi:hypothetical protein